MNINNPVAVVVLYNNGIWEQVDKWIFFAARSAYKNEIPNVKAALIIRFNDKVRDKLRSDFYKI